MSEDRELTSEDPASPQSAQSRAPLQARPSERLFRLDETARGPFVAFLALCFLIHGAGLTVLLFEQWTRNDLPPAKEEAAVEVVSEIPKPEEPPPQQPPPAAQQPPPPPLFQQFEHAIHRHEEAAPTQQKLKIDDKIATDSARAEKQNDAKLDAPDEETRSQRVAPPKQERATTEPEPQLRREARQEQAPDASPDEQATAPKPEEKADKPDAEVIEQAAPNQGQANFKKGDKPRVKAAQGERQKSIAEMVAALEPAPEFKSAGRSRGAPISTGSAEPEYKAVVYGYIMRKFGRHAGRASPGVIKFWIDPQGTLAFQELYKSSGSPALDQEALSALKRAAPFPPTPTDHQLSLVWTF